MTGARKSSIAAASLFVAAAAYHWCADEPSPPDSLRVRGPSFRAAARAPVVSFDPAPILARASAALAAARDHDTAELETTLRETIEILTKNGHAALARTTVETWANSEHADFLGSSVLLAAAGTNELSSAAAGWLATLPASRMRDAALAELLAHWAVAEPAMALEHLRMLPGDRQARVAVPALAHWLDDDPLAATQWLSAHESEPFVDTAVAHALATSVIGLSYPSVAAQWMEVIRDPDQRHIALENIATLWARVDAAAAQAYVEKCAWLDASQKDRIIESFGRRVPRYAE